MSKYGFQVQDCSRLPNSWVVQHARKATHGLLLNPYVLQADPWPWMRTMGRLIFEGEPDKGLIAKGQAGARDYVYMCQPLWDKCPWIRLWQGPNEPYTGNPHDAGDLEAMRNLRDFYLELARLMHAQGKEVGGPVFGTGQPAGPPANPHPAIDAKWAVFAPAAAVLDVLVVHQYGMRTLEHTAENEYHLHTHRRGVQIIRQLGYRCPPVWVAEFGIDYQGDPDKDGWRVALKGDEEEYERQLRLRGQEYDADPDVIAVTPFVWFDHNWQSFRMPESMSARYQRIIEESAPVALPAEPVQVSQTALQNGGFEDGFRRLLNEQEVANGWWPYYQDGPRDTGNGPYYNFRPEWKANDGAVYGNRTHGGRWSQQWFKLYGHYQAGIQQAVDVPKRSRLVLKAWSYAWCSWQDDPNKSVDKQGRPAKLFRKVGIDPTGNAVFSRDSVVWSPVHSTCDIWEEHGLTLECEGQVMVYLHAEPEWPLKHTDVYWDDVSLTIVPLTGEAVQWDIQTVAEILRRLCYGLMTHARGVSYNPEAALARYARQHNLGAPLFNESRSSVQGELDVVDLDMGGYRVRYQAFAQGIVACVVGQWDNVQHISW